MNEIIVICEHMSAGWEWLGRHSPEDLDPVVARAVLLKDQQLEELQYFTDVEACRQALKALALTEEEAFDDSDVVDFARRSSFCLQSNLALLNNSSFVYRVTYQVSDLGLILAD